jgi:hypothetical protein
MDDLMPHLEGMPIFLGMQHHHLEALRPWPAHHERGFLLDSQHELADPVLEDADFDSTFARVAASVEELIKGLGSGLPSNRGWPLP